MKKTTTNKLLHSFFFHDREKRLERKIQGWLISDTDACQKEEALEELWNEAEVPVAENIHISLSATRKKISGLSIPSRSIGWRKRFLRVAAIFLLPLIGSALTYLYIQSGYQSPEMQEYYVPNSEIRNLILPDGTGVSLNSGSYLIYPESFEGKTRSVYLQGEAKFTVAVNKQKPFIVKTNHIHVEAIGTQFNVRAYPESHYTTTTLIEGRIKVHVPYEEETEKLLNPSEQLIYYHYSGKIDLMVVDAFKSVLWENGHLIFQETPIEEIISTLERRYNVQINYDREKLNGQVYYIEFDPENTLQQALEVLEQVTGKFKFRISELM